MALDIGARIGAYRIEEKIGQGGMATVYRAYHDRLDRHVAIKVLHPAIVEDETFIGRFEREARVVARLEHPNIVPVYDFAEHDGSPYLVMKYIDGETLKERLARGPITPDEGLRIVDAVGSALAFAHEQGVLHRDVKPSNVIMTSDGDVFLADFGLARIAQAGESTISQDTLLGTPHYISPEQAKGVRDLGPETDIYSFGVMLYELVVGRVPFVADTPFSIIHDHIYTPLPPPRDLNPKVPEAVERVLVNALAKEPRERFSSASEFVQAFHRASSGTLPGQPTESHVFAVSPGASTVGAAALRTVAAPARDESTPRAATEEVVGEAERQDSAASIAETRQRRGWLWAGVGAVALFLLLGLGALVAWQLTGAPATPEATAAAAEAALPTRAPDEELLPYLEGLAQEATTTPPKDAPAATAPASDQPEIPELRLPDDIDPAAAERIEEAYKLLLRDPANAHRYLALADRLAAAGLMQQAITVLEQGAVVADHAPEYYLEAADGAEASDRNVAALMILEQGLLHNPEQPELVARASALMAATARDDNVLPVLESYHENFPNWVVPQTATARWYMFHDQRPRAAAILADLLDKHPDNPEAHYAYGELLFMNGESDAAIEQFQIVVDNADASAALRRAAELQIKRIESGGGRLASTPAG